MLFSVYRFRQAQSVVSSTPLSDDSQRITANNVESEKEAKDDVNAESLSVSPATSVHEEDEAFEWREVLRGTSDFSRLSILRLMLTDRRHT